MSEEEPTEMGGVDPKTDEPQISGNKKQVASKKPGRWLRWVVRVFFFLVLLLCILLAGLWIWSGRDGSLAQTISLAQRFVPIVGESLHVEGVQGALRKGGEIDFIRWQQERIDVQVTKASLEWNLSALFHKGLQVEHIIAENVHVQVESSPKNKKKNDQLFTMPALPEDLALPLQIDLNLLKVGSLVYGDGESALTVEQIQANYHYDRKQHRLQLESLHFDQGDYQADVSLTAYNPTLNASLKGSLESEIPGGEQRTKMDVGASLQGKLTNIMLNAQAHASLLQEIAVGEKGARVEGENIQTVASGATVSPSANLEANITLWDTQIVPYVNLVMQEFNLGALWAQAPQTMLSGSARVTGVELGGSLGVQALQFVTDIDNSSAGTLDQQFIPLSKLQLNAVLEDRQATLNMLEILVGKQGAITATGSFLLPDEEAENPLPVTHVAVKVSDINPKEVLSSLYNDRINGYLNLDHESDVLSYDLFLKALDARQDMPADLKLENFTLRGKVDDSQIKLDEFLLKSTRSDLSAHGSLRLPFSILKALGGKGEETVIGILNQGVADASADLRTPGITTVLEAQQFHAEGGTLVLDMKAPQVQQTLDWIQLFPWMPAVVSEFSVDGGFDLSANLQGGWEKAVIDAKFETTELAIAQKSTASASGTSGQTGSMIQTNAESRTQGTVATNTTAVTNELVRIKNTVLTVQGKTTDAEVTFRTGARFGRHVVDLDTKAHGFMNGNLVTMRFEALNVVLSMLESADILDDTTAQMKPIFGGTMTEPVNYVWDNEKASLNISPGVFELRFADREEMTSSINWGKTSWQDGVIDSTGSIDSFPALWLLTFVGDLFDDLMLGGDMMLAGKWQINTGAQPRIMVELSHAGGALTLEETSSAFASSAVPERYDAGINSAYAKLHNEGRNLNFEFMWDTVNAGVVSVDLSTVLSQEGRGWTVKLDAPLSGEIVAQLPELNVASAFFPTGWRFGGAAIIDTEVHGIVSAPQLKGKLTALGVSLRSVIDGLSFADGEVDIAFDSNEVRLNKLILHGEGDQGGDMLAQGYFTLPEKGTLPVVELTVTLNKFRASIHRNRQLALSGKLLMGLKDKTLGLTGNVEVDRALIIIDGDGAPSLDDDVVVISGKYATPVVEEVNRPRRRDIYGIVPLLNVKLDLGHNFRVQGYGLQTYLNGELELTNSGWNPMLMGTIYTERGRFKAYGQNLIVEKGSIIFSGNYMNPALDVLAIRAQTQERVGVNIIGTATHPRIRLYSESGLSESETLSWLILGRSASSDGTEMAILQQAAMALASGDGPGITGQLADTLGLDELSLGGSSTGDEDGLSGTTVTIGKRLSEKFYISYEQGLHDAMGTFFAFYDISRRLTLRLEAGEDTAVDLIYTFRFDGGKR